MADLHLPDCYYGEPVRGGHILDCICDRLRACRERALDEAREAVAGLTPHSYSGTTLACVYVPDAVAAIDALRSPEASLTR